MLSNNLIIGLGTGRCGTRSFAKFLKEHGINASHEKWRLVWEPDKDKCQEAVDLMLVNGGDVAFYWLNYIDMVLDINENTKFVCLKRKKEDVIASYLRTINDPIRCCMIWTKHNVKAFYRLKDNVTKEDLEEMDTFTREWVEAYWDEKVFYNSGEFTNHFPKYDLDDKESYLSRFYDEYYVVSEDFERKYPNSFKIFDMHKTLNTEQGKREVLKFIGIVPDTALQ